MKFLKPKFWDKTEITFFAILLFPISVFLKLLNFLRYWISKKHSFAIPVICVGNIYIGGTGKTPFCIELYSILKKINKNPAFIRKKYKSFHDEITLLKQVGSIYESSKRIDALKNAIKNKIDVAILDDGFQDFSLKKDLSIICFNEKQWIGNGFTIPSGPMREGLSSLVRANFIIINGKKNINIENKILEKNKSIKIFYTKFKALNADEFKNKKAVCFAGIGNPGNFYDLLKENNVNIVEQIDFPDHYNYSITELENLVNKAKENNVILLTTEKDYLRVDKIYRENIKYLKIKTEIENENLFVEEVKKFI